MYAQLYIQFRNAGLPVRTAQIAAKLATKIERTPQENEFMRRVNEYLTSTH